MGTPLMWAGMFHLFIGNLFIGILEAFVIGRVFKMRKYPYGIMILANYASSFAGAAILGASNFAYSTNTPNWITIYNARSIINIAWFTSFVATVALEWPFCLWALRNHEHKYRAALKASLLAQTVSYAILIPWFCLASSVTFYNSATIDPSLTFARDTHATVFYLSSTDGGLYTIRLDGSHRKKVLNAKATLADDSLTLIPSDTTGYYDLCLVRNGNSPYPLVEKIMKIGNRPSDDFPNGSSGPLDLRPAASRHWQVYTGSWDSEGLCASKHDGKRSSDLRSRPLSQVGYPDMPTSFRAILWCMNWVIR